MSTSTKRHLTRLCGRTLLRASRVTFARITWLDRSARNPIDVRNRSLHSRRHPIEGRDGSSPRRSSPSCITSRTRGRVPGGSSGKTLDGVSKVDQQTFWKIIEQDRGDAKAIKIQLSKLPPEEISDWHRTYYDLHNALHRAELWDVADIIYNNLSGSPSGDDSFHYFKAWLIGKGREVYETALKDPDELAGFITGGDLHVYCDNESLNYAAEKAWEALGKDRELLDRNSNEAEMPAGNRCDPENWAQRYPRLVKRFGACRW